MSRQQIHLSQIPAMRFLPLLVPETKDKNVFVAKYNSAIDHTTLDSPDFYHKPKNSNQELEGKKGPTYSNLESQGKR